jgi:hypothetical protein
VGASVLERRRDFECNLEAQLALWKADIDLLKAKSEHAGFDAVVHYSRFIDELQGKYDKVSHHLSSLRGANDAAWESLRDSTEEGFMAFNALSLVPARKH